MGIEYKIKFSVPDNYDPSSFLSRLPSPLERSGEHEIYNYAVEADGFYFVDHLVNAQVASLAFRRFVDEALRLSAVVQIMEP